MKKLRSLLAPFIILLASTPSLAAPDINERSQIESFVDGAVLSQMQSKHSASGIVTVMKDNKIIFSKGYGYQDVENQIPVDTDKTLFRIGSISKLFTWVSVMQQVERGNVDLDTDVNQYLKTFKLRDTWPGQPVTLRHLLGHTGGFEDGFAGYVIIEEASRIVPLAESLASHMPARVTAPGEQTAYSNWATALAGLIVANVSGIEFNQYVQENILDVLGMEHASFLEPLPAQLQQYAAKTYGWEVGAYKELPYEIIANFGPAGSMAASSKAMTNFARAIMNDGSYEGRRILKPETMSLMLSPHHSHDARTRGMAHGFLRYPMNGLEVIGHDGGTTNFISHFGLSLEHGLMLFTSFNGPGASEVNDALIKPFYDHFFPTQLQQLTPPSDFYERAERYAGDYFSWRRSFTKIESFIYAVAAISVVPMEDNTLLIGDVRYVEEDKNLFRELDSDRRVAFQQNEKGEITGFVRDGLAVESTYKGRFYETASFTFILLGVSLLVFIFVLIRTAYQWREYRSQAKGQKAAFAASITLSATNLLFIVTASVALITAPNIMSAIPGLFKFSLVFPILAALAALYHLFQSLQVWRAGYGSLLSRVRYSVVTCCGLAMLWIYYYWNLLGFNYFA